MAEHIQINDVQPRIHYVADGVQVAYAFPFAAFKDGDLEVYVGAERQSSGFTVTGIGQSSGGTVSFAAAPASGAIITLRRRVVLQRTSDFQADGVIRAKTLNDELDHITASLQQLADDLARSPRMPATSPSNADLSLPDPVAGRGLKWNGAGNGLVNSAIDPDTVAAATAADAAVALAQAGLSTAKAAEAATHSAAASASAQAAVTAIGSLPWGNAVLHGLSPTASGAVNAAAIQAAIDAGHKHILIPHGTYLIGATITAPSGVTIAGMGTGATVLECAAGVSPFVFTSGSASPGSTGGGVREMTIRTDGAAVIAITLRNQWGFAIEHVRFTGNPNSKCIHGYDASYEIRVAHCRFEQGQVCVHLADDCNSSVVEACDFAPGHNGTAILADQVTGVVIHGNRFEYASGYGGIHVDLNGSVGTLIHSNHIGANSEVAENVANIRLRNGANHTAIVGNRIATDPGMSGILISEAGTRDVTIVGNTFQVDGGNAAITIGGRSRIAIVGNTFAVNQSTTAIIDVAAESSNIRIAHNSIAADANFLSMGKVAKGIWLRAGAMFVTVQDNDIDYLTEAIDCDANNASRTIDILDNWLFTSATPLTVAIPVSARVRGNRGFVTEAKGNAAIPSGATSVTVAHGLAITPAATDLTITPTNNPTNDPGHLWVSSVGATSFTVSCKVDPGLGGAAFGWNARNYD